MPRRSNRCVTGYYIGIVSRDVLRFPAIFRTTKTKWYASCSHNNTLIIVIIIIMITGSQTGSG